MTKTWWIIGPLLDSQSRLNPWSLSEVPRDQILSYPFSSHLWRYWQQTDQCIPLYGVDNRLKTERGPLQLWAPHLKWQESRTRGWNQTTEIRGALELTREDQRRHQPATKLLKECEDKPCNLRKAKTHLQWEISKVSGLLQQQFILVIHVYICSLNVTLILTYHHSL